MRTIFVILAALALISSAYAGHPECDAKCQAYKHAWSRGSVPYKGPTICIAYQQSAVDNIVIRFYDANGKELDPNDPLHNRKAAPVVGTICPAAHWFREAARAELCNSFEGRWLDREHLAVLLKLGKTPAGRFVFLNKPRN